MVYWTGEGASKDIEAGRSLLQISCDGGYSDACVALRTLNEEDGGVRSVRRSVRKSRHYSGHIDGKLLGDVDGDGKEETVAWKKFASVDLGDYYQLLVIDDDASLLWEGAKKKDDENPLVFFSLDFGVSMPQILTDFDHDGSIELLAPAPQNDVSPTYYRKLRWRESYFKPLLINALMLDLTTSDRFVWKTTHTVYGTWISKLTPYGEGLIKVEVTEYRKDESIRIGEVLIRLDKDGGTIEHWLKPISKVNSKDINNDSVINSDIQSACLTGEIQKSVYDWGLLIIKV